MSLCTCGISIEPSHQMDVDESSELWHLDCRWFIPKVICLFVCLFALRPKSTAMVIAGRSVHLTTLFSWASLNKQLTSNRAHTFACN